VSGSRSVGWSDERDRRVLSRLWLVWCPECRCAVPKSDAEERPAREWADRSPTRGLAAKLDAADADEVSR